MNSKLILLITLVFLSIQMNSQEEATDMLHESMKKAKTENKNIFLKYGASWCAWCRKMDENMENDKCKDLFESNYVIVHLDVLETDRKKYLENPGAFDLLKSHKGEKAGLPFWVILGRNGEILEDSFDPKGENIGCPVTHNEVEHFVTILKNTSNLTDDELRRIAVTFYED